MSLRSFNLVVIGALMALVAVSCSISIDDVEVAAFDSGVAQVLPAVGPIPQSSHWHAAYVVRVCDDVLDPFESDNDPLGIHSHADGLMHIHPFFEESGYEQATLGLFADAMGFELADGQLTIPGGGTWRDGDLCNGVPGRVFVDRWSDMDPEGPVERVFGGLDELRFEADGELYQIGFAPEDSAPVVPPSVSLLPQVMPQRQTSDPWVAVGDVSQGDVSLWVIDAVSAAPCESGSVPELGTNQCFVRRNDPLPLTDAATAARAVHLNREPAIELDMTDSLRSRLTIPFAGQPENPVGLAIEVDGFVITAALLGRPPVGDRLVIAGGFTVESAQALAGRLGN